MGSWVQSTVGCFPELCLLQFSVAQVLVGLQTQFINNFVFPLGPVLLVLIIIIAKAGTDYPAYFIPNGVNHWAIVNPVSNVIFSIRQIKGHSLPTSFCQFAGTCTK